jgi:hypothetical protein
LPPGCRQVADNSSTSAKIEFNILRMHNI